MKKQIPGSKIGFYVQKHLDIKRGNVVISNNGVMCKTIIIL